MKSWETEERKIKQKKFLENYKKQKGYYPGQSPEAIEKRKNTMLKKMSNGEYEAKVHRGLMGHYVSKKTNINLNQQDL